MIKGIKMKINKWIIFMLLLLSIVMIGAASAASDDGTSVSSDLNADDSIIEMEEKAIISDADNDDNELSAEKSEQKNRLSDDSGSKNTIVYAGYSTPLTNTAIEYKNMNTKVEIICNKCGRHFKQKPNNHINIKQGCPFCLQSKLECEVDEILKNKDIVFEKQKRFSWLGKQSLDFYLPEYNLAIECQGEQHYEPVDFAGKGKKWATNNLNATQKRDKLKKKLCENNGVKILYYSKNNKGINL